MSTTNNYKVLIGTVGGSTCADGGTNGSSFGVGWGEPFTGTQAFDGLNITPKQDLPAGYPSFDMPWSLTDAQATYPNITTVSRNYGHPNGSATNYTGFHKISGTYTVYYQAFLQLLKDNPKYVFIMMGQNHSSLEVQQGHTTSPFQNAINRIITWTANGQYKDTNGNLQTQANYSAPTIFLCTNSPQRTPASAACSGLSNIPVNCVASDAPSASGQIADQTKTVVDNWNKNNSDSDATVYFVDTYTTITSFFKNNATYHGDCGQWLSSWVISNINAFSDPNSLVHFSPDGAVSIAEQVYNACEVLCPDLANFKTSDFGVASSS